MKIFTWITSLSLLVSCVAISNLRAQTLPVGTPVLEDYYRRLQLLGKVDSTISFNIRPLTLQALQRRNIFDPDSNLTKDNSIVWKKEEEGLVQLLPVISEHQYTSAYPYGWNDGAMIPNVGYQTFFSAGVYARYKFISLQLRPEFVYAQNKAYAGYGGTTEAAWKLWYSFRNNIDMPERFGDGGYTKLLAGQSSVRITFDPVSFGLSTENIWWGPGLRNSLLMSNTAPGFPHLTLNSTKPVKTKIGYFEGQLIAGKLKASGFTPTPLGNPDHYDQYYEPKPDDWRYLSGAIFSYQPKWVPGLSLGLSQSFVVYHEDMGSGLNDYLPFLGPKSRSRVSRPGEPLPVDENGEPIENAIGREELRKRDRYASFFVRWVMPKGKAEFYAEYGRNDPPFNSRDKMLEPEHSRAYVLGFRKLVPLKAEDLLQVNIELTQLDRSRTSAIRSSPSWYQHSIVRDGYTYLGQILGAGIGPGGSLQSLNVSWLRGMKQLGIQLERQEHDADFFYEAVADKKDYRKNWVDLSASLLGQWDYKNFLFNARMHFTHAFNYQYEIIERPNPTNADFWKFGHVDKFNFQMQIGAMYRF
uniref:Capsule assembly Wzi family protein n=1 Tax=Sphingobacterium sp. (strain 21) TaxID=743722 RepID=F4C897_SPHS2